MPNKVAEFLTKEAGPLPVWGWAIVGVGGIVVWRIVNRPSTGETSVVPYPSSLAGSTGGGGGGGSTTPPAAGTPTQTGTPTPPPTGTPPGAVPDVGDMMAAFQAQVASLFHNLGSGGFGMPVSQQSITDLIAARMAHLPPAITPGPTPAPAEAPGGTVGGLGGYQGLPGRTFADAQAYVASHPGLSPSMAAALLSGDAAQVSGYAAGDPSNIEDVMAYQRFTGPTNSLTAISGAMATNRVLGQDPSVTATDIAGNTYSGTGGHQGTYIQPTYRDPANGDYAIVTPGYWTGANPALGDTGAPPVQHSSPSGVVVTGSGGSSGAGVFVGSQGQLNYQPGQWIAHQVNLPAGPFSPAPPSGILPQLPPLRIPPVTPRDGPPTISRFTPSGWQPQHPAPDTHRPPLQLRDALSQLIPTLAAPRTPSQFAPFTAVEPIIGTFPPQPASGSSASVWQTWAASVRAWANRIAAVIGSTPATGSVIHLPGTGQLPPGFLGPPAPRVPGQDQLMPQFLGPPVPRLPHLPIPTERLAAISATR